MNVPNLKRDEMSVSIVIVSWNTRDLLSTCLETIRHQTGLENPEFVETIVVDNCSTDGTVEMLKANYPEVTLVENLENVGFARGTNQGVQHATGESILLLNPDTELTEHAISVLMTTLKSNPGVGAVGARLVSPDGTLQESAYPTIRLFREFWRLFHLDRFAPIATYPLKNWSFERLHRVDVVQGACLLVRRQALNEVGLLDEDYFMYTEEVDLCYRLIQAGWEVCWEPRAVVVHHGGQSTRQRQAEMFLRLYESKILFLRKHHGHVSAEAYKGLLLLASLPRVIGGGLAGISGSGPGDQRRVIARNYLQLLSKLPSM